MHPDDAGARGLAEGQLVRIGNARGACLAALRVSDEVRPGVVQISTGAWFDPEGGTCRNGKPQRPDARQGHLAACAGTHRPLLPR